MTKDDIARLAREAGWTEIGADLWGATHDGAMSVYALERFAALVAAAEREACAKLCDEQSDRARTSAGAARAACCAAVIRAMGQA